MRAPEELKEKKEMRRRALPFARQGELLRNSADLSRSIESFDQAIAQDPDYAWAYAHRGAVRAALGCLRRPAGADPATTPPGALDDLEHAIKLRGGNYHWAQVQTGEAYRNYVRHNLATLRAQNRFDEIRTCLQKALDAFDVALDPQVTPQPSDGWALAHRGATHTLWYVIFRNVQGEPTPEARQHAARGLADFTQANALVPHYAWALSFQAFLLTLIGQDHDHGGVLSELTATAAYLKARELLRLAYEADTQHRLPIQRALAELYNYEQKYAESVQQGWLALQADPEDYTSRYLVAVGMKKQKHPLADALVDVSRQELLNVMTRAKVMLLGLDHAQGRVGVENVLEVLELLKKHPSLEAVTHFTQESTLEELRKEFGALLGKHLPDIFTFKATP